MKFYLILFIYLIFYFNCYGLSLYSDAASIAADSLKNKKIEQSIYYSEYHKKFNYLDSLYKVKNYQDFLENALIFLEEVETTKRYYFISKISYKIGLVMSKNKNYNKAISYYKRAFVNFKNKDSSLLVSSYVHLSNANYHLYDRDTLVNKANLDSAIYYGLLIRRIKSNDVKILKMKLHNEFNLSAFFFNNHENAKSKQCIDYAKRLQHKTKDTSSLLSSTVMFGNYYSRDKDYLNAKNEYFKALNLIKADTSDENKNNLRSIYNNIAYVNNLLKNDSAYYFLKKANKLEGQLRHNKYKKYLIEIENKYNFDKKKSEAEAKTKEAHANSRRAQMIILILAFGLFVIVIFSYVVFRNQKLKNQMMALEFDRKRMEQQNKLDYLRSETQTKIINATLDAKEDERKALAETLHDSVSALLSSTRLHLQAAKSQMKIEIPEEIDKAQDILDEAASKIRNLSHEIISSVLLRFGLSYAVHDICDKYSNSKLQFNYHAENVKRYDQAFEIKFHNIIEELLNNIIKHSNATEASVVLKETPMNTLQVYVKDDGDGFDLEAIKNRKEGGLGLSQIEARIHSLKGVFDIDSQLGNGTSIFIEVPITNH